MTTQEMRWVKEKPSKEGWFWCKLRGVTGGVYVRPVHVYFSRPGHLVVYEDGDNSDLDKFQALEWGSSSIPVPTPIFVEGVANE